MFVVMSSTFWYYLFRYYVLFSILFIHLSANACFLSLSLGADDFENLQELDIQDFEQQLAGEQGK
jgi:hypothetical protein